jgi:hypothetical protein
MESKDNGKKRLQVLLSDDASKKLEALARKRSASSVQVIRQAIQTEDFLQKELEGGSKILIQKPDGSLRELVFSHG